MHGTGCGKSAKKDLVQANENTGLRGEHGRSTLAHWIDKKDGKENWLFAISCG